MNEEALGLADHLVNINKAKNMSHFEDAAKYIREMATEIRKLRSKLDELEKRNAKG